MSSPAAETYITAEEYLVLERKATVKSEYLNGEIRAMPRVNFAHNLITVDIGTELNIQSRGRGWEVCISNMRVRTCPKGAYFYPDVVAVCGEPRFEDNVFDTLLNPILIIEVLSPSTEAYDKSEKFRHYQELASLQEYILVSQDRVRVEQYRLLKTQWVQTEFNTHEDVLPLTSIRLFQECTPLLLHLLGCEVFMIIVNILVFFNFRIYDVFNHYQFLLTEGFFCITGMT